MIANLKGDNSGNWNNQSVLILPPGIVPDLGDSTSGPLNGAINRYGIQRPPGLNTGEYYLRFSVEQWSPFVSLSRIFDQSQSINAGFAVDDWRPSYFFTETDTDGNTVGNIFNGVIADLAVRDSDAWIYRLGYNITLLGKIVFIRYTPPG